MVSRAFKLRFRRRLRLRKLQVEEFGQQAEDQLERNFFRRLERLVQVRRLVSSWLALCVLLAGCVIIQTRSLGTYYKTPTPVPGGIYTEGILGSFTNASPLYATTPVDMAVSRLIFAGLFSYDQNNNLVGDLAQSVQSNPLGTVYTVKLKPDLTWQDGQPLTAADVVFTYQLIQNPDAQSPLESSWQGIQVTSPDPSTVVFTLPNPLASFPYSLTNGIVPKHILGSIAPSALRTAGFNTTDPVGAGPFKFSSLDVNGDDLDSREERIALNPFAAYNGGKPKLDQFVIASFSDQAHMLASYHSQQITAMAGLTDVPADLQHDGSTQIYNLPMTAQVMTFFRTSDGVLADTKVRQALVQATDQASIIQKLGYPTHAVVEPLLQDQVGFNAQYAQAGFNLSAAETILSQDGWNVGKDGIRYKNGQPLTFSLYAQNSGEYATVARELQQQWRKAGVDVQLALQDNSDFDLTLSTHGYDALLYGISIGKDPDVYVYWDSKNADIRSTERLNFSEYKSATADDSLEAGRTRIDPALRTIKYQPFLQSWQADAPAVGLYQPRSLYVSHTAVYGLSEHPVNTESDRYTNVQNWMFRVKSVPQAK